MKVKEFLMVCNFKPNRIIDLSGNVYLSNDTKYIEYENLNINNVGNKNGYIVIVVDTFGYE